MWIVERRAAAGDKKDRISLEYRLEILRGGFEKRKRFGGIGESIVIKEIRLQIVATRGDDRLVGVVEDKARMKRADAPVVRTEFRRAQAQGFSGYCFSPATFGGWYGVSIPR